MLFSRRKQPANAAPAIAEFWRWWPGVRGQVEKSINGDGWDDTLVSAIARAVSAIHPDLRWEFNRGSTSAHRLVIRAPGNPALRATAQRWQAAAPPADLTWSYHSSRPADLDAFGSTLTIDGHTVAMAKMRFGVEVDADRHEIDVTAFHPIFSVMTDAEQLRISVLALDWALGETDVEVWTGRVQASRTEPQRPHTVTQLRSAVAKLAGPEDNWILHSGPTADGDDRTAMTRIPLKPAGWPRFDTHLRVELPYRNPRRNNAFPSDASLAALRAFEDRLVAAVEPDGVLIAQETSQGRRTLHVYVDGQTRAAVTAKRMLTGWRERRARLSVSYDPSWDAVARLRR